MKTRRWMSTFATLAWMWIAAVTMPVSAMFVAFETDNVPIERVAENLERHLADNPSDVRTRLNLARLHAMAWATKADTMAVLKRRVGPGLEVGDPDFGYRPGFQGVQVKRSDDPEALRVARQHLMQAIDQYRAVLERDPGNVTALLGQSWCLDQAGEKARAVAGYRQVINTVWPTESAGKLPVTNFGIVPTTTEVAGYLIPLLDPQADAPEIATLRDRVRQLTGISRPVTPIIVPLRDDVPLRELTDPRARVSFDADGSGLRRRWTWVTPDAGWLVFDRHGTGQITSALQWFGPVTFWLFWTDGYDAMRSLDDNGDGKLTGRELSGLAIWRDRNSNGVSELGEVRPVTSWGIVALSYSRIVPDDDPTVAAWSPSGVTLANGRTRPTYDVLLFPR